MDEIPVPWETMLYDDNGARAGYATSLMYSPQMQRYIAIARVKPELANVGGVVHVENIPDMLRAMQSKLHAMNARFPVAEARIP